MKNLLILALVFCATSVFADVWLPRIFSDNMVLQAGAKDKIWGTANAKAKVSVSFAGKTFETVADENGNWFISTSKFETDSNSTELIISENGKIKKTIKNVLVGEVWVLGGQSNMEWTVKKADGFEEAKSRANDKIRVFVQRSILAQTPQKDTELRSHWVVASADTIKDFSAIGYYFAEKLAKENKTPVGLIQTALGGTMMQCWIPESAFTSPFLSDVMEKFKADTALFNYEKSKAEYEAKLKAFDAEHEGKVFTAKEKSARRKIENSEPNKYSPWKPFRTPSYFYNSKVAPIAGYTVKGVVWYQGEADDSSAYRKSFAENFGILVKAWREAWGNSKMPFYFFQLPSWETQGKWFEIRERQLQASKDIKKSRLINIIDTGDAKNIHPKDKFPAATRLFISVMQNTFKNDKFNADNAEIKSVEFSGNSAVVTFDMGAKTNKLEAKGDSRIVEVRSNGKWISVKGEIISANQIKVSADSDFNEVRYAYKNWAKPEVWLYSSNGMPVLQFYHKQ